jgi:hypothetical protein
MVVGGVLIATVCITLGLVGTYMFARLISTVRFHREHELDLQIALQNWVEEMRSLLLGGPSVNSRQHSTLSPTDRHDRSGNTGPLDASNEPAKIEDLDDIHTRHSFENKARGATTEA